MNQRVGIYVEQKIAGEAYKAYIPPPLPPDPPLDLALLYPTLEKATAALAELNSLTKSIPNPALFVYMYVRKEALLSSQIEGTQSSWTDLILFENHQKVPVSQEDVEEVSHYVQAIQYGLERLQQDFPLSLRLLREIHGVLLSGGRGAGKSPGEFRQSQNWIGGTRPGNALFVPPPVDAMTGCLSDFERFLHDRTLPVLIQAGLAHVQFETLHPFLDGNGRLGRLLVTLLFCEKGLLDEPVLYLSLYLKQNRMVYYDLLQQVRLQGTWETWLEFFLEGIISTCKQALGTTHEINKLFENDEKKIASLGRARFSCLQLLDHFKQVPQFSVPFLSLKTGMTLPTVRSALKHMMDLAIVEEITGKKRDKIYIYRRYLTLLEEGTEPFRE